jgi:hypothetical protein
VKRADELRQGQEAGVVREVQQRDRREDHRRNVDRKIHRRAAWCKPSTLSRATTRALSRADRGGT